jgi:hypothetical protein
MLLSPILANMHLSAAVSTEIKILTGSFGKNSLYFFDRYGPHTKSLQQFFYCCVCIHCRGKVFTEKLLRNERGRLVGGTYGVCS